MSNIKVLLVDDEPLVLEARCSFVGSMPAFVRQLASASGCETLLGGEGMAVEPDRIIECDLASPDRIDQDLYCKLR